MSHKTDIRCWAIVLLYTLMPSQAGASIQDVHIEQLDNQFIVEVVFASGLNTKRPANWQDVTKTFALELTPTNNRSSENKPLKKFSFSEPQHPVQSVALQRNGKGQLQLTLSLSKKMRVHVLPQYTTSHLVFTLETPQSKLPTSWRPAWPFKAKGRKYALALDKTSYSRVHLLPNWLLDQHTVYSVTATDADIDAIRVGFWDSERDARRAQASLSQLSTIVRANTTEQTHARRHRLNPQTALSRVRGDLPPQTQSLKATLQAVTPSNIGAETVGPKNSQPPGPPSSSLQEADEAFRAKKYARAALLYNKTVSNHRSDERPLALERLAISRELNGQLAHAMQNYRRYLADYPNTPGAQRVQQRMQVITALDQTPNVLQRAKSRGKSWRNVISLSQFYRRHTLMIDDEKNVAIDGVFTDVDVNSRHSTATRDHEARLSVTHLLDQTDNFEGRNIQVSTAFWDTYQTNLSTGLRIGRQSKYDAGVIGRFDGITVRHSLSDRTEVGVVAGYLLDSSFDAPNSDRPFYGAYARYTSAANNLTLSPFVIQQKYDGIIDRQAVGLQTQWVWGSNYIMGMVDYDFHHGALNNLTLTANLGVGKKSSINLSLDQRKSPYITTRNALIGQPLQDLSDLERELVDLNLKQLASDRTATSRTLRIGWNRKLSSRWEFTTDFNAIETSDTKSSAAVVGYAQRRDFYYSMQMRANNLFGSASYSGVMVRRIDNDTSSTTSLYWNNRLKVSQSWWIYPRIRIDQRSFDTSNQDQFTYIPSLRVDYKPSRRLGFEMEIGYQKTTRQTRFNDINIEGLFFRLGYRAIF